MTKYYRRNSTIHLRPSLFAQLSHKTVSLIFLTQTLLVADYCNNQAYLFDFNCWPHFIALYFLLLSYNFFSKYLPKRLWSFLVPCTVPSGSISRWNPVLQYNCLLLRMPLRCVKSAVALRESLSPVMRCSPSSVGLSPKGLSRKWDPTCGTPSMPCKTPPTSPRAAAAAAIASKLSG